MSDLQNSQNAKKSGLIGCGVFSVLAVSLLFAISGPPKEEVLATDPAAPWPEKGGGLAVSQKAFEARRLIWPLEVQEAVIGCKGASIIWLEVDDVRYALNGAAKAATDYSDFDVLWLDNPYFPANVDKSLSKGPKINVDDLFRIGEMQCDRG